MLSLIYLSRNSFLESVALWISLRFVGSVLPGDQGERRGGPRSRVGPPRRPREDVSFVVCGDDSSREYCRSNFPAYRWPVTGFRVSTPLSSPYLNWCPVPRPTWVEGTLGCGRLVALRTGQTPGSRSFPRHNLIVCHDLSHTRLLFLQMSRDVFWV